MAELKLEIITPYKSMFTGIVKSVTVPGTLGSFQILINHAPIMSTFEIGVIKVVSPDDKEMYYATSGGTVEVNDNKILILADAIEDVNSIDKERAQLSLDRAKQRLANKEDKTIDVQRAEASLKRAINRLKAVEKKIRSEV